MAEEFSHAVGQALASAFGLSGPAEMGSRPRLSSVIRAIRPDQLPPLPSCTPTATGENCNWPVSYQGPCPQGGTITVSGDVDESLNNDGAGSVSSQLSMIPANCGLSALVINGDPSVDVGLQLSFAKSAPVFPETVTEIGGIFYGPKPSGSCQLNVTYTVASETSCTLTGTVCGQSVAGSC